MTHPTPEYVALIGLLRREGKHSGVWFAHKLIEAADALEAQSRANVVLAERVGGLITALEFALKHSTGPIGMKADDALYAYRAALKLHSTSEQEGTRIEEALREMVRLNEEMGLYDDEAVPLSPNATSEQDAALTKGQDDG
jgi:hypothetical protein